MKHQWWQPFLIPFTLLTYIASLVIVIFYRPSSIRYYKGCFDLVDSTPGSRSTTIWGRPGAQSWGCRINWFNTTLGLNQASLRVHERIHTLQGEWVNAAAHVILVPLGLYLGGWWLVGCILLAQLSFGISYLSHFMYEWSKVGFKMDRWKEAYLRIWAERIAYKKQDEYEQGMHKDAWGS